MFHILLSCESQGSMECMYVCMGQTELADTCGAVVVTCTSIFQYIRFWSSSV